MNDHNNQKLRMDAYYYGFELTGAPEIDLILSAVACAGKSYHHTDQWNEETDPRTPHTGNSPAEWIQNAAIIAAEGNKQASAEIARLQAENEALRDGANFRAIQSLRQDCESLRKDAERYRFLRRDISNHSVDFCIVKKFWDRSLHDIILEAESADAQIDAAMSKEG